jgi:hypothetical protein
MPVLDAAVFYRFLKGVSIIRGHLGENVILVFFSSSVEEGLVEQIAKFQGKAAVRNKIKLPPVLFINGIPLEGPRTQEAIRARIEALLDL